MAGKWKRRRPRKTWKNSTADILKAKMSRGKRKARKCESKKIGQSLCVNKRNNIRHLKGKNRIKIIIITKLHVKRIYKERIPNQMIESSYGGRKFN